MQDQILAILAKWEAITRLTIISLLLSGCSKEESISNTGRFGADPVLDAPGIWSDNKGMGDFYAADQNGQLFNLVQCKSNSNLYTVWRMSGETNGFKP